MNKNIVVVYGSGASYASGYKVRIIKEKDGKYFDQAIAPPTDQKFFIEIEDEFLKEEYYALWMFKNSFFGPNSSVGMEEVWTALDLNHKHITLNTYDWDKETSEYITLIEKKEVADKYPRSDKDNPKFKLTGDCGRDFRRLIYNVYSRYEMSGEQDCFSRLHEALKSSTNFIGYITFNFDCYLEHSLNNRQFKFKYINANSNTKSIKSLLDGGVPIIKLHGSLSWEEKCDKPHYEIIQHAFSLQVKPEYQSDSTWFQPAIIPPTIFKQEINDDSRRRDPLTQIILQQWRAAITILQEADIIIFVGYSFPASDFHAKRIFQISNMIRRKNGKQSMQILDCIGPKNDEKEEKRKLLKSIFGCDTKIITVRGSDKLLKSKELQELLSN
ncbi:MAG: SIR2 family protein [archaeon]|nr:SIR2 family protein [archaeon]